MDGTEERVPVGVYRSISTAARVIKRANRAGKGQRSKTGGKKGGKGGETRVCWSCGKTGHIAANCVKGSWNMSRKAVEEDKEDISEEVHEDEDELHAWCLLEVSESEQWQEVTSKKSKLKTKKFAHESLLSVQAIPARVQGKPLKWKTTG